MNERAEIMEASQYRFTTLNHVHFSNDKLPSESASFHFFTHLPAEIRLLIWELSLPSRRRLITLRLTDEDKQEPGLAHGYKVSIEQLPRAIPQSNVCVESRQAVRQRFRLPLLVNTDADMPVTIWINPESDHFFLPQLDSGISAFTNFIIDLKNSDVQGQGILHIAFRCCKATENSLRALSADLSKAVPKEVIPTLRDWALGLQSIWFIYLYAPRSRQLAALNRWSMPIFPRAVEFDLLEEDTRFYPPSLRAKSHVILSSPDGTVMAWEQLESQLGIRDDTGEQPSRPISKIIAATARRGYSRQATVEVRCAGSMDEFLQREQDDVKYFFDEAASDLLPEWEETEEKENLLSVAGFWRFPSGTYDTPDRRLSAKECQDLMDRRPGLGVFEL